MNEDLKESSNRKILQDSNEQRPGFGWKLNDNNTMSSYTNDPIIKNLSQHFQENYASNLKEPSDKNSWDNPNHIHNQMNLEIKNRFHLFFGEQFQIQRVWKVQHILKIIDCTILLIAWIGSILAIIATEYNMEFYFDPPENKDKLEYCNIRYETSESSEFLVTWLRSINVGFTCIMIILLFVHYYFIWFIKKLECKISNNDGLWSSGLWKLLLWEVIWNIFVMPPKCNWEIVVSQRGSDKPKSKIFVDIIITILQWLFRSYHIVKYIVMHSRYFQYDCEKICWDCNVSMDFLFAIKAEFQERPFIFVSVVMVVSIVVFGYSVRGVEMFFMYGAEENKVQDWRHWWNGFWCIIITMSTVGFGDFYPVSVWGRAIVVLSSFWGTFLISLMVAALTVAVEFNAQEAVAHETIKAAQAEIEYGKIGVILFQTWIRFNNHLNLSNSNPDLEMDINWKKKKSSLFDKLKKIWYEFRLLKKTKKR